MVITKPAVAVLAGIHRVLPSQQRHRFSHFLYRSVYSLLAPGRRKANLLSALSRLDSGPIEAGGASGQIVSTVETAARSIYGDSWNEFSNALCPGTVACFESALDRLSGRRIDYLEIGSAQGVSMGYIGVALRQRQQLGMLVSVDPYLDGGYVEEGTQVTIDKSSRERALALYASLGLNVELLEKRSCEALRDLMKADRKFHLIYIDGFHSGLTPTLDFGLSCQLLHSGGIIMLDDHVWPDITGLKRLCDRNCELIYEWWKTAAYKVTL